MSERPDCCPICEAHSVSGDVCPKCYHDTWRPDLEEDLGDRVIQDFKEMGCDPVELFPGCTLIRLR